MVFEGADGAFGSVATVEVRRCQLEINVLGVKELLKGRGGFIV
jgi:hypothetical protein